MHHCVYIICHKQGFITQIAGKISAVRAAATQDGGLGEGLALSDVQIGGLTGVMFSVILPTGPWGALLSSILGLDPCTGNRGGGISCLLQDTGNHVTYRKKKKHSLEEERIKKTNKLCVPVPLTGWAGGTWNWGSCSLRAAHWEACT